MKSLDCPTLPALCCIPAELDIMSIKGGSRGNKATRRQQKGNKEATSLDRPPPSAPCCIPAELDIMSIQEATRQREGNKKATRRQMRAKVERISEYLCRCKQAQNPIKRPLDHFLQIVSRSDVGMAEVLQHLKIRRMTSMQESFS